jgi:hypothetical protein
MSPRSLRRDRSCASRRMARMDTIITQHENWYPSHQGPCGKTLARRAITCSAIASAGATNPEAVLPAHYGHLNDQIVLALIGMVLAPVRLRVGMSAWVL